MRHCLSKIDYNPHAKRIVEDNNNVYCALLDACHRCNLRVVGVSRHDFWPRGLTAVVMIAESHVAIHTYPEDGLIFIDAFTCGGSNPAEVIRAFAEATAGKVVTEQVVER